MMISLAFVHFELELEQIQTHMAQKPVLRVEVGARAFTSCASLRSMPSSHSMSSSRLSSDDKARNHSTVAQPLRVRGRKQLSMEATALSFEVGLPA